MARMQRSTVSPIPTAIERPTRPVRPTRPQAEPELKGGWMSSPPETCKHRKFDGRAFFVEPSMCVYHCPVNATCKVYQVFQEGAKQRKRYSGVEEVEVVPPVVEAPKPTSTINRRRRN